MGSATSYYLARRGKRVLGLERFGIPHSMGSSHGHTRIIRLAYYEHPSYVLLLKRAYELWREIQRTAGERLLHITGSIDAGPGDSWVFKGSWDSCKLHDLPHEVLTGAELQDRKSTRLNSSHANISYAVFCLKKKTLQLYIDDHHEFDLSDPGRISDTRGVPADRTITRLNSSHANIPYLVLLSHMKLTANILV